MPGTRRRFRLVLTFTAFSLLVPGFPAFAAATFTRITDPANPVVTDAFESGGGAWADLDGDGLLDLFVASGNLTNQPDQLYKNLGGGAFARVVNGPVVTAGGSSIGAAFGDFDRDGALDLFVTNRNNFGNFLFTGLEDTAFARVVTGSPVTDIANSNSSSWVDADGDGDLDLYVVNFGGADFFYRNDGGPAFTFTRMDTVPMVAGFENSIPGAWADYDGDGDEDLFLGNAGTQNDYLWTNRGGFFFTKTTLADARSTLGASWGDFDNDGDLDLFVAMFQNQKSILYRNDGPPLWTLSRIDTSIVANDPGNSVGSAWGDFDNDGDLDLFVANDGQNNFLYENLGPPEYGFHKITTGSPVSDGGNSFGCGWADYDNDGALDLFVANRLNQTNFLYHNDGNANHWLAVALTGVQSSKEAIGARVSVHAVIGGTGRWLAQEMPAQTGYNSQTLRLHFGLGDAAAADTVRVRWPSGIVDTWVDVAGNRVWNAVEGATVGVPGGPGARPGGAHKRFDLRAVPSPFAAGTRLLFTLPRPGRVTLALYDAGGRRVATLVDAQKSAGPQIVPYDASAFSGFVFAQLVVDGAVESIKLVRARSR
jgi:hypothetical protein